MSIPHLTNFESAFARDAIVAAQRAQQAPKIIVRNINDIKRLLAELDPINNQPQSTINLNTDLSITADGVTTKTFNLSVPTKSKNKREILLDGLTIAKNRQTISNVESETIVNNKSVKQPKISNDCVLWVDALISAWFGAYREGAHICWDLNDGYHYRYNIFENKLTRLHKTTTENS